MDMQAISQVDLIVQSFIHVASQLARPIPLSMPSEQYEQIRSAAERHNSALNMVLRDVIQMADKALRKQSLTRAEHARLCMSAAQTIADAKKAIARTVSQHAAPKLATSAPLAGQRASLRIPQ